MLKSQQDDSVSADIEMDCDKSDQTPSYNPSSCNKNRDADERLDLILVAWPRLPEDVRSAIYAMIRAIDGGKSEGS